MEITEAFAHSFNLCMVAVPQMWRTQTAHQPQSTLVKNAAVSHRSSTPMPTWKAICSRQFKMSFCGLTEWKI